MSRSRTQRLAGSLLLLLGLAGCGAYHRMTEGDDRPTAPSRVFSPNGEPLRGGPLGHPSCRTALTGWFDRLDAGHSGGIDFATFRADAKRQFAVMDLDHDGEVTPDELAAYRAPYEADTARRVDTGASDGGDGHHRHGDGGDGGGRRTVELPDPVMLADVDLRNRVTLAQFMAYADRNFADLDTNHDRRLEKSEILGVCGAAEDEPAS